MAELARCLKPWKTESRFHNPVVDEHMRAKYLGEAYVPPVERVVFYQGRGKKTKIVFETSKPDQKAALERFLATKSFQAFPGRIRCHISGYKSSTAGKVEVRDQWVELSVNGWPYAIGNSASVPNRTAASQAAKL